MTYALIRGQTLDVLINELQSLVNRWDPESGWRVAYVESIERWVCTRSEPYRPYRGEALTPVKYAEEAVVWWKHELGLRVGVELDVPFAQGKD